MRHAEAAFSSCLGATLLLAASAAAVPLAVFCAAAALRGVSYRVAALRLAAFAAAMQDAERRVVSS